MGAVEDVAAQFINNNDKNTLYEGSDNPKKVGDIRGMIKYITWDLLRFQKPIDFKVGAITVSYGLRDSVSRQHLLAEQNNWLLKKIAENLKINITELPGA